MHFRQVAIDIQMISIHGGYHGRVGKQTEEGTVEFIRLRNNPMAIRLQYQVAVKVP